MLSNLSYKKKNRWLLAALLLLGILSYRLAIRNTLNIRAEVKEQEDRLLIAEGSAEKMAALRLRLSGLDRLIGSQGSDSAGQQGLLTIVTAYCKEHKTVLREFPPTIVQKQGEYEVETSIFTVEGSYIQLVELLYLLEQKQQVGKVASVDLAIKKDNKTRSQVLWATIFIQNVRKAS